MAWYQTGLPAAGQAVGWRVDHEGRSLDCLEMRGAIRFESCQVFASRQSSLNEVYCNPTGPRHQPGPLNV